MEQCRERKGAAILAAGRLANAAGAASVAEYWMEVQTRLFGELDRLEELC